jgi:hypothetical protein
MIAGVLVERNSVLDVVVTNEVAASPTVVPPEEPCEGFVTDVASYGRRVGLPVCCCGNAGHFSQLIVEDLTGCTAETATHRLEVTAIALTLEESTYGLERVRGFSPRAEAAFVTGWWSVRRAWASWDVGCSS